MAADGGPTTIVPRTMNHDERERVYGRDEYYWGTRPNALAGRTLQFVRAESTDERRTTPTLVDVGAGEGRDAVFFAEQGFDVYATDVSPNGLAKAERLANERGVEIDTFVADVNQMTVPVPVDVVYSAGAIQYIEPENRRRQFRHFREATTPGGIHVMFAFVDDPDVPTPPDWTQDEYFYAQGELQTYYSAWETLDRETVVFEDDSGGQAHEHVAEILVSRKPP